MNNVNGHFEIGHVPWNKGKTGVYSDETRQKMGVSKGNIPWNKGGHHTRQSNEKNRLAHLGKIPWNKGKTVEEDSRILAGESNGMFGVQLCGQQNPFFGKRHSEKSKKQISKNRTGLLTGEDHPCWKGGKTPLVIALRNSVMYRLWRKAIFHKDKFQCQDCGDIKGGNFVI